MADLFRAAGPGCDGASSIGQSTDRRRQKSNDRLPPVLRVVAHLRRAAVDRPDERPERQKLAVGEESTPSTKAVAGQTGRTSRVGRRPFRHDRFVRQAERNLRVERFEFPQLHLCGVYLRVCRQPVLLACLTLHHHRGHAFAEASRQPFRANVLRRRDRAAGRAPRAARAHRALAERPIVLPLLSGVAAPFRDSMLDAEVDPAAVRAKFHREANSLLGPPAEPARLQQGDLRAAAAAANRPRPQIRHGRLRDPAWIALVLQVERIELLVERPHGHSPVLVRPEHLRRSWPETHARDCRRSPPSLSPHRFELRVRRVAPRQFPPRRGQHPPSPRPQMPRDARDRRW